MTVVTRIAPSPTGDPHVGTAYIGLFNFALARNRGGRFILRIEDTDRERYNPASEERILDMMGWLGLEPDESPRAGGPNGPYRQSERLAIYREHIDRLLATGRAYRAFESAAELDEMRREQKRRGQDPGYDGRGRSVPVEEQLRRAEAGEAHVVRLLTPDSGSTSFRDELRGDVTIPNSEIRDPVLLKSDGFPTYHLANVVDDHLMEVTHVVRAEEWITSTPIHALLYEAFGWAPPLFAHMPLLRNPDRNKTKISKRKLDTSVDSYRAQGIVPEALLNFLGNMGWSMPDGQEFFSVDEMIASFSLERVSLGGPVFDLKKLRHFNARYLRDLLPLDEVARRAAPLLRAAGHEWDDDDYLLDVIDVLLPRAETLIDFVEQSDYFFEDEIEYDEEARKRLAAGQAYLEDLERRISMLEFFDYDSIDELIHDYVQEQSVPMGKVMMPLRAALSGRSNTPSVIDLITILGKGRVLSRIGRAIGVINAALPDDNPQKDASSEEKNRGDAQKTSAGR